jgi:hypothetical protein
MITSRGTVEFGALPEPGGPTHFHIMKGTGQDGSGGLDLFFGDDYNYVRQRPAQYGQAPAYGVEIGANDISTSTSVQRVWRFGTDGALTFPSGAGFGLGESGQLKTNDGTTLTLDFRDNNGRGFYTNNDGFSLRGNGDNTWKFGTNGVLTLPAGGDIVDSNGTSVLGGDTDRLVNGDFSVYLQSNGSLVIPIGDRQENESRYQGAILSENESSGIYMDVQTASPGNVYGGMRLETWNSVPIDIRTRAGGQGNDIKNWRFDSDGALTLPAGGTISYTPDDADNWNEPAVNTVQAALDELAARITALQNYEIDGGNAYTPPQGEFIIDGNGA